MEVWGGVVGVRSEMGQKSVADLLNGPQAQRYTTRGNILDQWFSTFLIRGTLH